MHFGTPRIANSSASVSITSSLVMLRSTFKAKHSRVYSSTIDSHFSWLPARRVIEHKVPAPNVVFVLGPTMMAAVLALPESPLFPLLLRHFQPLPTPQPIHPRVAGRPGLLPQQRQPIRR